MRGMRGLVLICAGLVLLACMVAEARDNSGIKTVVVNCNLGDSINEALAVKADQLIIEIRGTCQEDVFVARDDVTLRGVDPDATVVAQANQAIWIDRALRVTLENLTVTGSTGTGIEGAGIYIVHSSGVVVSNVTSEGNRWGMRTYGSSLRIVDSDFCRNSGCGLYIGNGSSLLFDGEEINLSENGSAGIVVSESALRSPWITLPRVVANDNGFAGVMMQFNGYAGIGELEAKRNGMGIYASGGTLCVGYGSVDISDNGWGVYTDAADANISIGTGEDVVSVSGNGGGLYAGEGAFIGFQGTVANNSGGCAFADGGARISLQGTVCQNNGWGVLVHGATARIQDSNIQENEAFDVDLSFGARATFDGVNTVGVVYCDDTVLVEGDVGCSGAKSARAAPPQMERVAPMLRQPDDFMAPRLLP